MTCKLAETTYPPSSRVLAEEVIAALTTGELVACDGASIAAFDKVSDAYRLFGVAGENGIASKFSSVSVVLDGDDVDVIPLARRGNGKKTYRAESREKAKRVRLNDAGQLVNAIMALLQPIP